MQKLLHARSFIFLMTLGILACNGNQKPKNNMQAGETSKQEQVQSGEFAIAIHGGAGNARKADFSEQELEAYKKKLEETLNMGVQYLKQGKTSVQVVEAVIHILENSPLFNAGKGAVFTHAGTNELDASIMNGKNLNAGAVAGVGDIKNPITAARFVMEESKHVMLSGAGASQFARKMGVEVVDSSYFYTEKRWNALQRAKEADKHGTVGCVVLDKNGNLAAGTSTGGMTNKMYGRIGDSPVIGAGTYANNATCAISATGHGEYFIRYAVAHDISALMEYNGLSLQKAADRVILGKLKEAGANGGVIGVDKHGNLAFAFNTNLMFRAKASADGNKLIRLFSASP